MKNYLFLLFVILLGFSFSANAQSNKGNRPEKPTPAQMTEKLAQELNLTDDQKAKVLALNEEYADYIGGPKHGFKPPKDGEKPDGGQKPPELTDEQKAEFEAKKAKRDEYETKLKAILTDEQITTMEANRKKGPKK